MAKKKVRVETLFYTQADFALLWEARAVKAVWIETKGARFDVTAELVSGVQAQLVNVRKGQPRQFLNPAAALMALRRIGVTRVEVRMEGWDLDLAALSMRMRPDVTARRRRDKRAVEAMYYPDRAPEPAVADRKDRLGKLIGEKMREAGLLAEAARGSSGGRWQR